MEITDIVALPVTNLDSLVLVASDGSGERCSYLATMKTRASGVMYRVLTINDSIRMEAQSLLEIALRQADAAAVADAQLFAAGQDLYASAAGRSADRETAWADRRVVDLQRLSVGLSDFGQDGWVDVQDWRELLKHFGRSLSIGAI